MTVINTKAARELLDVHKAARELRASHPTSVSYGHTWIDATLRSAQHVALTPWRVLVTAYQALHALSKVPTSPVSSQPRMVTVIVLATCSKLLQEAFSLFEPLVYPSRLVRTCNAERLDAPELYAAGPQTPTNFSGLWGWLGSHHVTEDVSLWHPGRYCWGQSLWAASLYEHAKSSFDDAESCLVAIAKQCNDGATKPAMLLQGISASSPSLTWTETAIECMILPLSLTTLVFGDRQSRAIHNQDSSGMALVNLVPTSINAMGPDSSPDKHIDRASCGTYLVRRGYDHPCHEMVFVKVSQNEGYVLDLDVGLTRVSGDDMAAQAAKALGINGTKPSFLTKVAKRGVFDVPLLDLRRRWTDLMA